MKATLFLLALALAVLAFGACSAPQAPAQPTVFTSADADRLYQEGLQARRGGELLVAEERFRAALDANPRLLAAHLALGDLYAARGDWAASGAAYQRARELRDRSIDAQLGYARAALRLENWEAAREAAQRAQTLAEQQGLQDLLAESFRIEGETLLALGSPQEAIAPLERALEIDPTNLRARIQLAELFVRVNRRADAVRLLTTAAATAPTTETLLPVARSLIEMGAATRAVEPLQQRYNAGDRHDELLYLLSHAHLEVGRRDIAIQIASELIQNNPSFARAFVLRARAELRRARETPRFTEEALERCRNDLRRALELDGALMDALVLQAEVALTAGDRSAALVQFRELLQRAPLHPDVVDGLFQILRPEDDASLIREVFTERQDRMPMRPSWRATYANALRVSGEHDQAIPEMSRAAQEAESVDAYHLAAAQWALAAPDVIPPTVTLQHARRAFDLAGATRPDIRALVVDAHLLAGQRDEARRFLEESLRAFPEAPELLERRAAVGLPTGRRR